MPVKYLNVQSHYSGQRLDNFLLREYKGVPKTRLYRAIRRGEVRINGKRAKPDQRVVTGDELRLPPLRQSQPPAEVVVTDQLSKLLESRILIENKDYIMINKPAGLPVHGGTRVSVGLIEALRKLRPRSKFLELVHRLDRDTSGCLLIAKKRSVLIRFQEWFRGKQLKKRYWVLVKGKWDRGEVKCDLPLMKNHLQSGERMVRVSRDGKQAITIFRPLRIFDDCSLIEATLKTGRTHQIRVHLQSLKYPIAGDVKYGEEAFNKLMRGRGLKRMFLQSMELSYRDHEQLFGCCSLLDEDLAAIVRRIDTTEQNG